MPKTTFQPMKFRRDTLTVIDQTNGIIAEYLDYRGTRR